VAGPPNKRRRIFGSPILSEERENRVFYLGTKRKEVFKMKGKNVKNQKARLIALISRQEMDFIDKISKDALFSTGRKLTRTDVVSAILDVVSQLPITGRGVYTEEDLRERLRRAIEAKVKEKDYHERMAI